MLPQAATRGGKLHFDPNKVSHDFSRAEDDDVMNGAIDFGPVSVDGSFVVCGNVRGGIERMTVESTGDGGRNNRAESAWEGCATWGFYRNLGVTGEGLRQIWKGASFRSLME